MPKENNGDVLCYSLPKSEGARECSGTIKRKQRGEKKPFPNDCYSLANRIAKYLQSWEERLQRVNPRVHQLPAEHVHVDVEGRVPFPLVTGFATEEPRRAAKGEERETAQALSPQQPLAASLRWNQH